MDKRDGPTHPRDDARPRRLNEELREEPKADGKASEAAQPGRSTDSPDDAMSQAHVPHEGDQH